MKRNQNIDFAEITVEDLMDHIVDKHHLYSKQAMKVILRNLEAAVKIDGKNHPTLTVILDMFKNLKEEMELHLHKESQILFPFTLKLLEMERNQKQEPFLQLTLIENTLKMLISEHEKYSSEMSRIRKLSNNYTPSDDFSTKMKSGYDALNEFEKELHQHIYLENKILFPKMVSLEKKIKEINLKNNEI